MRELGETIGGRVARKMDPSLDYDNIGGNFYDKYNTRNPIARYLVDGFLRTFDALVAEADVPTVYEVGCGEGALSLRMLSKGLEVRGSDVDSSIVETANRSALAAGYSAPFSVRNIYDLQASEAAAELVICCEVLEHVPDPVVALDCLATLARPYLLVSVPREPLWKVLNIARGKYIFRLGDTPGHINHWSTYQFVRFLRKRFDVITIRTPLPWTMALCRLR
ncbi:class I SAM-dependent methyltransferase [Hyphomicrobium sp.]|jgi:2-polyprenyl-3-methyl-5-hydroxy-6-metoxy-1,4-benzoquinol methylase|uniref:class I SAM-dependent methyltransferase n=1 Tax=Hyphomicrobium sp. TaxID=82 RepID=UPI003562967F